MVTSGVRLWGARVSFSVLENGPVIISLSKEGKWENLLNFNRRETLMFYQYTIANENEF